MLCFLNTSSTSTSEPTRSCTTNSSAVLSSPEGAPPPAAPLAAITKKRVIFGDTSWTSLKSTGRSWSLAAARLPMAAVWRAAGASAATAAASAATAAELDAAGTSAACGYCAASQRRHWPSASGFECTSRTSEGTAPGATISACATLSCTSAHTVTRSVACGSSHASSVSAT
jgi:hypothetical protein